MSLVFGSLFSGSTGNVCIAATRSTRLLVDAGVNASMIEDALNRADLSLREIDGVLITHEHIDHIRAVGVLARRYEIPIYANAGTWRALLAQRCLGQIPPDCRVVFETGREFTVGDIAIHTFPITHDTVAPVGFALCHNDRRVTVATDLGVITPPVLEAMLGADAVLIEANHDVDMLRNGPYPAFLKRRILSDRGHLSNLAASQAILTLIPSGVRRIALGHLSQQNNTPEVAWHTVTDRLIAEGLCLGRDVSVEMTWPDRAGATWVL